MDNIVLEEYFKQQEVISSTPPKIMMLKIKIQMNIGNTSPIK